MALDDGSVPVLFTDSKKTFAMIKPDGALYTAAIIRIIRHHRFHIFGRKLLMMSQPQAEVIYQEHAHEPWFRQLIQYITGGPVTAMVLGHQDKDPVTYWREVLGDTDPNQAAADSIRGQFGKGQFLPMNIAHGSATPDDAKREVSLIFSGLELIV